jgi:hypothetical protein
MNAQDCKIIAAKIKQDLESAFPGWIIKQVIVRQDQDYTVVSDEAKSLPNFYHLYPHLSKPEADDQIVRDMEAIIKRHLPDAQLVDFEQEAHDGFRRVELPYGEQQGYA